MQLDGLHVVNRATAQIGGHHAAYRPGRSFEDSSWRCLVCGATASHQHALADAPFPGEPAGVSSSSFTPAGTGAGDRQLDLEGIRR